METTGYIDWGIRKQKNYHKPREKKYINCACCGEKIHKDGPTKLVCRHKGRPKPGMVQECVKCGELKGYDGFYDYRDSNREGDKLFTVCKECIRERNLKRYREKK